MKTFGAEVGLVLVLGCGQSPAEPAPPPDAGGSGVDASGLDVAGDVAGDKVALPGDANGGGDGAPDGPPAGVTRSGCPMSKTWTLKISDRFGTDANSTVHSFADLHARYDEAQFYNRDANGLVLIPNVVINGEQETYSHFETAVVFSSDHLTIQGRGHPDGTLTSAELVSKYTSRSFCVEGRYRIPSADKSWPAFWLYGADNTNDSSEIDFEQPVTPNQGVHDVSMYNHPSATNGDVFPNNVTVVDTKFTTAYMTWHDPSFDASAAPHDYTACYDDQTATITRCIDGRRIYSAHWTWNASEGGTGHGPDACTTFNLAVGGSWPGNLPDPRTYSADLDLYSIEYYGP
jgi:hypothetical protein